MHDPQPRWAIGIDVGGTNLRAALVEQDGICRGRINERVPDDPGDLRDRIDEIVAALDGSACLPVGIGLPGRVDVKANVPVSAGHLDLAGLRIARLFGARRGRVVQLDNDASMALRAEMAIGSARDAAHVVMLTIGTGIGGALALDGRIVTGNAFAGQLGHVAVETSPDLVCKCGRCGCVETTSSGPALKRLMQEAQSPPGTTASDLLDRADAGDTVSVSILRAWACPLRNAIESIVAVLDPQLVVLGGGLGRHAASALRFAPSRSDWFASEIVAARLGDDAGVIGAGLHALEVAAHRDSPEVHA